MFDDGNFFNLSSPLTHIDWQPEQTFSAWNSNGDIIGNPDGSYVEQTTPFTCAVVSQEMILHDFGINVSEAELVYEATANGWLSSTGTSIEDMGRLLENHGISTHANYSGDVHSLVNELAHGHKVIVAVDSGELWNGQTFWQRLTGLENKTPDHAIVVSGLDFSNPNNPMVIVNDPGTSSGAPEVYPLNHFLEAWNDSNCSYIATNDAPADVLHQPNFNQVAGIFESEEFWMDVIGRVAVFTGAAIVGDDFTAGSVLLDSVATYAPLALTVLDEYAKNELFLEI
jgi:hypothetical protein